MKLTTTPNTNRIATPANTITPVPPVDGNSDPVLFSMSITLSSSFVSFLEIVHLFTSASALLAIVTLIGSVNLLNPSGAFVSTKFLLPNHLNVSCILFLQLILQIQIL